MKLADSFKFSLNNILHRQLRSWLTLLGIIIGVTSVVAIISIGDGANASINDQLSGFGADIITLTAGASRTGSFGGNFRTPDGGGGPPGMEGTTNQDSEDPELGKIDAIIAGANSNVESVLEKVSGRGELVFLSETMNVTITGVNPLTWEKFNEEELESGRFLGASDSSAIVIGGRLANDTFKQPITLGRRLAIEDRAYTVVGILDNTGNDVLMSLDEAWLVTDVNKGVYSSIQIKVDDDEKIDETVDEITESLMISRKVTEDKMDFSVSSPTEMQEMISETVGTMTLFLAAIAAVSLIVGAVGVANSMFTSVLEKTKEIGIMKALGATSNEIMILFIIESGLFGLVGGIIGVLLGVGASVLLSMAIGLNTLVTIELMTLAIVLSTLIGVVSGLIPARAASELRPIEALRYE